MAETILWHGAHPDMPTGYANQARIWVSKLAHAGHQVAFSCLAGPTSAMSAWKTLESAPGAGDGKIIPVYPCTPYETLGQDVVAGHYKHAGATLAITLTCSWVFTPMVWRDLRTIMITPVDTAPLPGRQGMGIKDYEVLANSAAMPAAVCRTGETQMRSRGLDPLTLFHGIDTGSYVPPKNRKKTRQGKGLDHLFVVGMNAMNHERARKNFNEAFGAFAAFHAAHPRSVLALHTQAILPEGLNLPALAREWDITDAILWSDQYQMMTGMADWAALADWYGSLDVLLSLGNEGFGLPVIEAQACGTPVIAGNWGPGPELAGETGWLAEGQPEWNNWHLKHWRVPRIGEYEQDGSTAPGTVLWALEQAYAEAGERRPAARAAALAWDAQRIWEERWEPALKDLA